MCAGTLSDYQFMRRHTGSQKRAEKAKEAWGASLNSLQDVYRVFTKYTSGGPYPACSMSVDCPSQSAWSWHASAVQTQAERLPCIALLAYIS